MFTVDKHSSLFSNDFSGEKHFTVLPGLTVIKKITVVICKCVCPWQAILA